MTAVFALALVASCCAAHPARAAGQNAKGVTAIEGIPVELEGELDVLYEDDDTGGRLRHFLIERDRRIPLYFQDGAARDLPSGTRVRVTGLMRKDGNLEEGGLTVTSITVTGSTASGTMARRMRRDSVQLLASTSVFFVSRLRELTERCAMVASFV